MAVKYNEAPAFSPPRDLDWEMLALKLAILDPEMYAMFDRFHADPYCEMPAWIPAYIDVQKMLGIYPMNGKEGDCMRGAVWKLMGK